jgi:prepilin-type N-terminal cleavage/methylation domain-containing protein
MQSPPDKSARNASLTAAFTLIELSIVLVIIGLVVGGVLVGQDLIRAAYLRAQIAQIDQYNQAVNTFYAKYQALPGDMNVPTATQFGFTVGPVVLAPRRHSAIRSARATCFCTARVRCLKRRFLMPSHGMVRARRFSTPSPKSAPSLPSREDGSVVRDGWNRVNVRLKNSRRDRSVMEHEFWRARLKERCAARGYSVAEEFLLPSGQRVDLRAVRGDRTSHRGRDGKIGRARQC